MVFKMASSGDLQGSQFWCTSNFGTPLDVSEQRPLHTPPPHPEPMRSILPPLLRVSVNSVFYMAHKQLSPGIVLRFGGILLDLSFRIQMTPEHMNNNLAPTVATEIKVKLIP